jgi:hypothetical protein
MNRKFAKLSKEQAQLQLESEMHRIIGSTSQIIFDKEDNKREVVDVITPASHNWKKKDRRELSGGRLDKNHAELRKTPAMVDIQQIVYPPTESARRVKLLHHV